MTNGFKPMRATYSQPMLSKEEYAERKRTEKENVYQLIDTTAAVIVQDPQKFKAFLDTQSRMDRYSAANALLIFSQYPKATQLRAFDDWGKDNVKISKGARSVSILEPVEYTKRDGTSGISYNVKKVFDISQTNARRPLAINANLDPKVFITVMFDISPVDVEMTNELPYDNQSAFYDGDRKTLYVKRNVGDSAVVAQCVARELGRVLFSMEEFAGDDKDVEFRSACVGYMLCKKYGVDTQNFDMSHVPMVLGSRDTKEIREVLSGNRNVMSEIHSWISDELYRKRQERINEYAR